MRVFLAGAISAHLVGLLKGAGHRVGGRDPGLFAGCGWEPMPEPDREIIGDVRSLTARELDGFDCVMHPAAISNDPMGDLDPGITHAVDARGSTALARAAKAAGAPRFLLSSSCSIYGRAEGRPLAAEDELNPVLVRAQSKIAAENGLAPPADRDFSPGYLRNPTAFGHCRRCALTWWLTTSSAAPSPKGEIRIMSDRTPWRRLIHCKDIARAFVAFLKAPQATIHNQRVNVGGDAKNYRSPTLPRSSNAWCREPMSSTWRGRQGP